jgi:hypothetical protein
LQTNHNTTVNKDSKHFYKAHLIDERDLGALLPPGLDDDGQRLGVVCQLTDRVEALPRNVELLRAAVVKFYLIKD